ncbi:MAG: hypothetical protein K1X57_21370 [Gemmataceae bacterium]|nr:hypothetical protein [Gemmataceae bacterium]
MARRNTTSRTPHRTLSELSILEFWQLGQLADVEWRKQNKDADPNADPRMDAGLKEFASNHGLKPSELAQAMRAARRLSRQDLDELSGLIKASNSRFGTSHLTILLSVTRRSARISLARRAIKNGWGFRDLNRVIRLQHGTRKHGGRKFRAPENERVAAEQFIVMTKTWLKWCKENREQLPKALHAPVSAAVASLTSAREASETWVGLVTTDGR